MLHSRWFEKSLRGQFYLGCALIVILLAVFPLLWIPGVSHRVGVNQEPISDFFSYFYFFDSLIGGFLPAWDPFHDGGQPFYLAVLGQRFNFIELSYVLLAKIPTICGLKVNYYKLALSVNYLYLLVSWVSFQRLVSFFWSHPWASWLLSLIGTFVVASFFDYNGFYISGFAIYAFFPLCFYYLLCVFSDRKIKNLALRLGLGLALLVTHAGIASVSMGLVLFSLFLVLAASNPTALIERARARGAVVSVLVTAAVVALILSPLLVTYMIEANNVVREGRVFQTTTFDDFIQASQGSRGLERFNFLSYHIGPDPMVGSPFYCGLILQFLFFVGFASGIRKRMALICLSIFQFSVVLMESSPFLILYYELLFPFLRQARYWGGIYDSFIFVFFIWVTLGAREIWISRNWARDLLLPFGLTLASAWVFRGRIEAGTWLFFAALSLLFFVMSVRILLSKGQKWESGRVLVIAAIVLSIFDLAYKSIIKNELPMTDLQGNSWLRERNFRADYNYPRRRTGEHRPADKLGNYVFFDRTLTYWTEGASFIHTSRSARLRDLFKQRPEVLNTLYGVTRDILSFSASPRLVESEELIWRSIQDEPNQEVIFIPPEKMTEIRSKVGVSPGLVSGREAERIEVRRFTPNTISVSVLNTRPGFLVWRDGYHQSWRARIDRKLTDIFLTDGNFKGVFVSTAGLHDVEFNFGPSRFQWALYASYLTVLFAMVFLVFRERVRK